MKLAQLNEWYNRYQHFWTDWKNYKFNGLTKGDIFTIELYRDNHFRVSNTELRSFHQHHHIHEGLENPIVVKFQQNYGEYKEWVTSKFLLFVFRRALLYGLDDFLECPLDQLKIENSFKNNLKEFNCRNVQEIFTRYNDVDFLNDEVFSKVLQFKDQLLDERRNMVLI